MFAIVSILAQDQDRDQIRLQDHLMLKDGKVDQVRDQDQIQLKDQLKLNDGTLVNPDEVFNFKIKNK